MEIKWLGHATFLITTADGTSIITDPYEPGAYDAINYGPITMPADIVTVSHEHEDHNHVAGVPGDPHVVREAGEHSVRDVKLYGISTFHDSSEGDERGTNTIFVIESDGMRICHLGDLGHSIDAQTVQDIGHVDVLLVPVGGYFTVDADQAAEIAGQLNPKLVVPMHFKTERCSLPIADVEGFVAGKDNVQREGVSEVTVDQDSLPATTVITVLEPAL